MPDLIAIDEPVAELRSISVLIVGPDGEPVTGIDETDVTIVIRKPGGAYAASSAALVEDDDAVEGGTFDLVFPVEEVDTRGDLKFEISSGEVEIETVRGYVTVKEAPDVPSADDVAAAVLTAVRTWSHDEGRTFEGLMIRLESILSGKKTETDLGGSQRRIKWHRANGDDVAFEGTIDIETEARGASDVTGSEVP